MSKLCWLIGLWRSLQTGQLISGHDYVETEHLRCEHLSVQVLTCYRCGDVSVGWSKGFYDARRSVPVLPPEPPTYAKPGKDGDMSWE